jgi:protein-L-isoaspartate(D-aspartate) O-methyltransferase
MRPALLIVPLAAAMACVGTASEQSQRSADQAAARLRMIDTQLRGRDIRNPAVLEAMQRVPRHEFVPEPLRHRAYEDGPLPIGDGQTISQPYIVAYMTQAIEPAKTDRVLEIGTGSGYQAAVLAELVAEVYTIEIVPALAASARTALTRLGYKNIRMREGDGYAGWPDAAPFDKVVVTAAPDRIPQTLVDQLKVGGIMAVPVGREFQMMTVVRKTETGTVTKETLEVRFVPMIKKY